MKRTIKILNLMRKTVPQFVFLLKYMVRLFLHRFFRRDILYPRVVNYSATNKCNYRCVMCNVWKQEYSSGKDMSPGEIRNVYGKPLFKKVESVGISGGEPFLRRDIREVVASICDSLPRLKRVSIITNASLDCTVERLVEIKKDLDTRGISLDVEVSIDGIGETHDRNRGVPGAFDRTLRVFHELHSLGLVNRISTTITRVNCNVLWQTYRFAKANNIKIDYRLASLIKRLHNQDLYENFCLTDIEKLRVIKFLENIIYYYEKDDFNKQIFYTSLIGQLKGYKRQSGCDWSTSYGVSLDPYGNLFFCFPRSGLIDNINNDNSYGLKLLSKHADKLYKNCQYCDICTHDYHGLPDLSLVFRFFYDKYIKDRVNYIHNSKVLEESFYTSEAESAGRISRVSIIGWYGTETLGDKAILGGIVYNLLKDGIQQKDITIASLHPTYTKLTLHEMQLEDIEVVDTYQIKTDLPFIMSQDLFIFGGGPLCDIEPMLDMLTIFMNAKKLGKRTFIYAAGIGPLKEKRYIEALNKFLAYTDRYCFRDELSITKYKNVLPELFSQKEVKAFIDPATNYIRNRFSDVSSEPILKSRYVLFSFRDWLYMYADGLTEGEFEVKNSAYETQMVNLVKKILGLGLKVVLFPMHTFYIGSDDREYYFSFLKKLEHKEDIILIDRDNTPLEALNYFKHAEFSVCLRFHSVVFSVSTNTPCIAIDYHYGKGKISGFMSTVGLDDHVYSIDDFNTTETIEMVEKARKGAFDWDSVNKIISEKNNSLYEYMSISREK